MSISSRPLEDWSDDPSRPAGTTKSLLIAGVNYVFCWIPAGEFWMGSVERQERGFDGPLENGVPVHKVRLTRGFWALSTPVTQEMHSTITGRNPSFFKGNDRPAENVSWNEFQSYISALNEVVNPPNGWRFRMPTEAQWEYACRAGTTGERHGEVDEIAWHRNNSGDETIRWDKRNPTNGDVTTRSETFGNGFKIGPTAIPKTTSSIQRALPTLFPIISIRSDEEAARSAVPSFAEPRFELETPSTSDINSGADALFYSPTRSKRSPSSNGRRRKTLSSRRRAIGRPKTLVFAPPPVRLWTKTKPALDCSGIC